MDELKGLEDISIDTSFKKYSLVDLLIVNELERNALMGVHDISRRINVKYDRVLRRVESISKQGIVDGIGVGLFNGGLDKKNTTIFIGGLIKAYPYHRLVWELARVPGLGTMDVDPVIDRVVITLSRSKDKYSGIVEKAEKYLVYVKV